MAQRKASFNSYFSEETKVIQSPNSLIFQGNTIYSLGKKKLAQI